MKKSIIFSAVLGAISASLTACNSGNGSTTAAPFPSGSSDNFYISYYTPADVKTQVGYQKKVNANGVIIWEMSGDVDPSTDGNNSLIKAVKDNNSDAYAVGYWADWNIYSSARALPFTAYFIPGAIGLDGNNKLTNANFDHKALHLDAINYAFLEISPDGLIYFNDPWADLDNNDRWCGYTTPQGGEYTNDICQYAYLSQGKKYTAQYGNFEAFADYKRIDGKPLDKYISVGGYGHDSSFEDILGDATKVQLFATSTKLVLDHYKLTGIDLDYENPNMTNGQAEQFADLVATLSSTLGSSYKITVTILSNPAYINGENNKGFTAKSLKEIAALTNVKYINLMTYDFYGAFNYQTDGKGRTGFLGNTYMPNNAPSGSINFSVQTSIQALMDQGVPAIKVGAGIPTYGRALQGINSDGLSSGGEYSGLYATIPSSAYIPRGNLDSKTCVQDISGGDCTGSFTYSYILSNFGKDKGFSIVDWQNNSQNQYNGTTGFNPSLNPAPVVSSYSLAITNTLNVSGGIGLQVQSISNGAVSVGPFDWLAQNSTKTYTNDSDISVQAIQRANALVAHWTTWTGGPSGDCPAFNFTQDTNLKINPSTKECTAESMVVESKAVKLK